MNLTEKQLAKKYVYNGKIINLRVDDALLPNGKTALREVVEHPGGVCVAALTDQDEILLVKQFRYPYMEEILEIPAGKRDKRDEAPLECGKRELREETGAVADEFVFLGELYPTPGYCDEVIYIYAAKNLTFGETDPDDDEFLDVIKMPFNEALERVLSGEIKDAKTQTAVLKLKILKDSGRF
ncbi:MAG: NUDIX hydrolase [Acutalibacteraceae bacterium]|nr:NUDIX hydrolase [Acutalibacteraceae bacterium]